MSEIGKENTAAVITTAELVERLKESDSFEFWNVLTEEYYSNENIAGSRHVPLDRIGRELSAKNFAKDTEFVVYCTGPRCPQSAAAAEKLIGFGFENVRVYKGGLEEWETAGLVIEQDKREAASCH